MDKEFQIALLKTIAPTYPSHALGTWDTLMGIAPGCTEEEKRANFVAHLAALEHFGYIENFGTLSVDGRLSANLAFRITAQGLLAAGEDLLCPDPYTSLREALLEQSKEIRSLSPKDEKSVRNVLAALPAAALERLRDKGLDMLLGLLLG